MDYITQDEALVCIKQWLVAGESDSIIRQKLVDFGFVDIVINDLLAKSRPSSDSFKNILDGSYVEPQMTPHPLSSPAPNTSGMGDASIVPEEIKGWSWGGFLWSWIWAIGNNVWIGLLALIPIPFLAPIIQIILGINGRQWAWQRKHWDSVEHFKSVQKQWAIWGAVLVGFSFLIVFLLAGVIIAVINPQKQIKIAQCARDCQNDSNRQLCLASCQAKSTGAIDIQTPTQVPESSPTIVITPSPTPSNLQSNGVQSLENGISANIISASVSDNILTTNIIFTNTTSSPQNAYLFHLQIHDSKFGGSPREQYAIVPLSPNESQKFTITFETLPNPPFKIGYAMPTGDYKVLGTYTP